MEKLDKKVVIALTQDEAKIWATGLDKDSRPQRIHAPAEKGSVNHLRQTLHQSGHSADPPEHGYFDVIADHVKGASEILLIGHGDAKASAVFRFMKFMRGHDPDFAEKIVGELDVNLNAMTDNEILATAREWFDAFHRTGLTGPSKISGHP